LFGGRGAINVGFESPLVPWTPEGRFRGSPHPVSPLPPPQVALLVLSAALEAAPEALAPHGPALAALCRGALAPGVPPGPMAYGLRALGGLAAMLGDTQTVSGAVSGRPCPQTAVSSPPRPQ